MKTGSLIIFLAIVLTLYGLINFYIFSRAIQAIPTGTTLRIWFIIAFRLIVSTFVLGRFLERTSLSGISTVFTWTGSFWLAAMFYFLLIVLLVDLSRLLNHFLPIYPAFFFIDFQRTKSITLVFSIALVGILLIAGHINTLFPRIKHLELTIPKQVKGDKQLTIVMASDIHLGTIIGKNRARYLVRKINSLNPDIIILDGDVVDEDLAPVIRQNIGDSLKLLKARLGVWAITGNHEYIGGVNPAVDYLTKHNIRFIRDTFELIDDRFYLIGREDKDRGRFIGKRRKTLEELFQGVDLSYPVILLDHQPFNLAQAASFKPDLQLSGHTHHGQIFPINLITSAIYELSWGYKKIGETHFYVSSGFGTWGPPVRIGSRSEIVEIILHFK
ncbi:MAG: metallophosphoesterase [Bacteroidetes bacterium]|nr:metallophosphoesterase [Bacteroidota bacterium]